MTEFPNSLREINRLPVPEKEKIYASLLPDWLFNDFTIDPDTFEHNGHRVVQFVCPAGSRALEIIVRKEATDHDPIMYLNLADTFNNQLLVLLVVVNDPESTRFNVDIDQYGNRTNFGTTSRNIAAEIAAMNSGLAPGQIRRGLRAFRSTVPIFESFVSAMGHDMFLIEPLSYHNAIVFERYGFNYLRGLKEMERIHREFQPTGELYQKLNPENPFRGLEAWKTVRNRSWAIHDGILGHPFTGFQMYKRIGIHSNINTFPGSLW